MNNIKKTFWKDAAKAGLVLGGVVVLLMIVDWQLRLSIDYSWATSMFNFAAIAVCVYVYGKKRAIVHGDSGFSYGESMSYILAITLFSGFISGVGSYLMKNHIAPEYYNDILNAAVLRSGIDIDNSEIEKAMGLANKLTRSALFMIFSGLLNMVIYGCFVGLIASIFIKKQPNPFANTKDVE